MGSPPRMHATTDATTRKTQITSPTTRHFQRISPRWSAFWVPHRLRLGPHRDQLGGFALHEAPTRRRHATRRLHVVQNPHRSQRRAPRCIQDWRRANFFALAPTSGRAGRQISRTGHRNMAAMKPTTPLLTPNTGPLKPTTPPCPLMQASMKPPSPLLAPKHEPLKPTTPLRPATASKTPVSHPQRRWRFQLARLAGPQRRHRFQSANALH